MADNLLERIKRIEERLDTLEKMMKTGATVPLGTPPSSGLSDLLALPSSLQKTMLAIQELKEATSSQVALTTGRDRTVETIYLNQLVRLGFLSRERQGRKVYFKPLRYY